MARAEPSSPSTSTERRTAPRRSSSTSRTVPRRSLIIGGLPGTAGADPTKGTDPAEGATAYGNYHRPVHPLERLINLVALLLESGRPLPFERIRELMPAYQQSDPSTAK